MSHSLTNSQRDFIKQNESSPRLEEIAEYFKIKPPTVYKILEASQSKGYLFFGRNRISGFFIGLNERAG